MKVGGQASDIELTGKADSWTLSACVGLTVKWNQTVLVKDGGKCFCYFMHIVGKRSMGGPHPLLIKDKILCEDSFTQSFASP